MNNNPEISQLEQGLRELIEAYGVAKVTENPLIVSLVIQQMNAYIGSLQLCTKEEYEEMQNEVKVLQKEIALVAEAVEG